MGCTPSKKRSVEDLLQERAASGDVLGTMELAEKIKSQQPDDQGDQTVQGLTEALIVAAASEKSNPGVLHRLVQLGADVEVRVLRISRSSPIFHRNLG